MTAFTVTPADTLAVADSATAAWVADRSSDDTIELTWQVDTVHTVIIDSGTDQVDLADSPSPVATSPTAFINDTLALTDSVTPFLISGATVADDATYPLVTLEIDFSEDPSPGFRDVALAWSPVGYWRLDETSGSVADDLGSGSHDGTYTGGVTLGQSSVLADGNAAALLDGSTGYVSIPYGTPAPYENFLPPWTLSAWIKPTAARSTDGEFAGIITRDVTTLANESISFMLAYGRSDAAFAAADCVWCGYWVNELAAGDTWFSICDPTPVRLNEWQHYVAVCEVASSGEFTHSLSIYRNGVRVAGPAKQAVAAALATANRNVLLGRRYAATAAGHYFPGTVDEALIFDRALTEVEIAKLYASSFSTLTKLDYTPLAPMEGMSSRVRSFSTRRGRQDSVARVEAGQATIVVDNRDDLLSPDPLVNLLTNPSFEVDETTGWSVTNGTRSRVIDRANIGTASLKLTSDGAGACYISTDIGALSTGLRPGRTYTFSAYVYLDSGEAIATGDTDIRITDTAGSTTGTQPGAQDSWLRISATRTIDAAASSAYVRIGFTAGGAGEDMWIDNLQLEEAGAAATYADGDQADCRWNGRTGLSPTHCAAAGSYPNILPMRMARLSCAWPTIGLAYYGEAVYGEDYYTGLHTLIEGPITSLDYSYPGQGFDATVTLNVVDGMAALASATLSGLERPQETAAERVAALLKAGGIPADRVEVDTASVDTNPLSHIAADDVQASPLEEIRKVEETELGLFFVKADGTCFYHGGSYRTVADRETLVLYDDSAPSGFDVSPYTQIGLAYDEQNLINDLTITNSATEWVADVEAPDSIRRYWPRAQSQTSLFADPLALTRPRSEAIPRVEPTQIAPATNPAVLWPLLLGLEISDLVRVLRTNTRDVLRDYLQWVEGIEHNATPSDWRVTLHTSAEIVTGSPAIAIAASGIADPTYLGEGLGTALSYRAGRLYVIFLYQASSTAVPSAPTPATPASGLDQIRSDTYGPAGSGSFAYARLTAYSYIPAEDITQTLAFSGGSMYTARTLEIAYGFDAADPIGASNGAQANNANPTINIGTFDSVYSRGLFSVSLPQNTDFTYGRFFDLEQASFPGFSYSFAYGPEGTNIFTCVMGISETHRMQAVEVKAAIAAL